MAHGVWQSETARLLALKFGDPERGVVRLTQRLLAKANLKSPPFYPDRLAVHCGVKHVHTRRLPRDGLLVQERGGFVIYISRRYQMQSGQWNAICAHELGHILLLQVSGKALGQGNSWIDEEEYLADRAARELLLPAKHFQGAVRTNREKIGELGFQPEGRNSVSRSLLLVLTEVFRAPTRMIARRLAETGLWSGLTLEWKLHDKEFTLNSWWPERHESSHFLRRNMKAGDLFGPDSGVSQALEEGSEVADWEAVISQPSLFWRVHTVPISEYSKRYAVSFVVTPPETPGP